MYLHTSPEFAMKKLLAAGETRIHAFAHVWRNRERGALHSPEFTMLEWYRVGEDYERPDGGLRGLPAAGGRDRGGGAAALPGPDLRSVSAEPERLRVAEAFRRHAGIDLLATMDADGTTGCGRAGGASWTAIGLRRAADDTWSDMLSPGAGRRRWSRIWGMGRMTILDRYPAAEAALARPAPDDARVAERFELYACGVELANGFGELTDPAEQRRRFEAGDGREGSGSMASAIRWTRIFWRRWR